MNRPMRKSAECSARRKISRKCCSRCLLACACFTVERYDRSPSARPRSGGKRRRDAMKCSRGPRPERASLVKSPFGLEGASVLKVPAKFRHDGIDEGVERFRHCQPDQVAPSRSVACAHAIKSVRHLLLRTDDDRRFRTSLPPDQAVEYVRAKQCDPVYGRKSYGSRRHPPSKCGTSARRTVRRPLLHTGTPPAARRASTVRESRPSMRMARLSIPRVRFILQCFGLRSLWWTANGRPFTPSCGSRRKPPSTADRCKSAPGTRPLSKVGLERPTGHVSADEAALLGKLLEQHAEVMRLGYQRQKFPHLG
jgi:hypothetical protein